MHLKFVQSYWFMPTNNACFECVCLEWVQATLVRGLTLDYYPCISARYLCSQEKKVSVSLEFGNALSTYLPNAQWSWPYNSNNVNFFRDNNWVLMNKLQYSLIFTPKHAVCTSFSSLYTFYIYTFIFSPCIFFPLITPPPLPCIIKLKKIVKVLIIFCNFLFQHVFYFVIFFNIYPFIIYPCNVKVTSYIFAYVCKSFLYFCHACVWLSSGSEKFKK